MRGARFVGSLGGGFVSSGVSDCCGLLLVGVSVSGAVGSVSGEIRHVSGCVTRVGRGPCGFMGLCESALGRCSQMTSVRELSVCGKFGRFLDAGRE